MGRLRGSSVVYVGRVASSLFKELIKKAEQNLAQKTAEIEFELLTMLIFELTFNHCTITPPTHILKF